LPEGLEVREVVIGGIDRPDGNRVCPEPGNAAIAGEITLCRHRWTDRRGYPRLHRRTAGDDGAQEDYNMLWSEAPCATDVRA